jgi:glycosyltransferase involved in cell wall biosynthesis
MKLSIVVPAYNAEKYIENCMVSCISQDLDTADYEVIVVNDGSKDDTEKLVSAMSREHHNIVQIFQENQGNGAARNSGAKNAKGEYILFLDADDYIAHNTLGTLVSMLYEHNLDMLGFSSINVQDSKKIHAKQAANEVVMDDVLSGIDFLGTYNYKAEVWWYFIKRSFYVKSGVSFYNRKFVQDSYLTPTLFSKANRASFVEYDVHRYRQSPDSITRNKTVDHLNQHFNDLSFAIEKIHNLRQDLIKNGTTNEQALQRLHVKQQRYVFIVIVRFIKSKIPTKHLAQMLMKFNTLEAYPMDKFMSLPDYKSPVYMLLTFISNRKYLLYPLIKIYRFLTP